MMKITKLILLPLIILALFNSCNDESNPEPTTPKSSLVSNSGIDRTDFYDKKGYDNLGYQKPLSYQTVNDQIAAKFNKKGFNSFGKNFLGITEDQFESKGYDAIWFYNLDNKDSWTLDQLIAEYNRVGYQLYDVHIYTVEAAINTAEDLRSVVNQVSDEVLKRYLRKSIRVFEWLYSGSLSKNLFYEPAPLEPEDADQKSYLNRLHINLDEFKLQIPSFDEVIDFQAEYNSLYYANPIDFSTVKNRISAAYQSIASQVSDSRLDPEDVNKDRQLAIRSMFSGIDFLDAKSKIKAKYTLKVVYNKLERGDISETDLLTTCEFVLQGGWHCNDRKNDAIDTILQIHCLDEFSRLNSQVLDSIGKGLALQQRAFLKNYRESIFKSWIHNRASNTNGDQASSRRNLHNLLSEAIGLDRVANAHQMPITNHAYYYNSYDPNAKRNVHVRFLNDFMLESSFHNDPERIKGYSVKDIIQHIITVDYRSQRNPTKEFFENIWGPLMTFDQTRKSNIYASILTRFGVFKI